MFSLFLRIWRSFKVFFDVGCVEIPCFSIHGEFSSKDELINDLPSCNIKIEKFIVEYCNVAIVDAVALKIVSSISDKNIVLLINLKESILVEGKVFAVLLNKQVIIRRVFISGDSVILKVLGENKSFPDILCLKSEIIIIGRAFYHYS